MDEYYLSDNIVIKDDKTFYQNKQVKDITGILNYLN